jgi:hypothetical protein
MIGSNTIRNGVIGVALACAGVALVSGGARAVFPHSANVSPPPIVLASEREMIQCTKSCDRDFARCGRNARCRAEHDACIRYCV